jgi:hypothetical protein
MFVAPSTVTSSSSAKFRSIRNSGMGFLRRDRGRRVGRRSAILWVFAVDLAV